jgi:hypothetical protein
MPRRLLCRILKSQSPGSWRSRWESRWFESSASLYSGGWRWEGNRPMVEGPARGWESTCSATRASSWKHGHTVPFSMCNIPRYLETTFFVEILKYLIIIPSILQIVISVDSSTIKLYTLLPTSSINSCKKWGPIAFFINPVHEADSNDQLQRSKYVPKNRDTVVLPWHVFL